MSPIREIPEVAGIDAPAGLVRIPPEQDVPLTPRVRALIDTADFRRLARISQLGLVSLVYPAAIHTRFEHSLGVYRLALLYLRRLSYDARFAGVIGPRDAEKFIVAALVHDLGHWPFCHPIEDLHLPNVPKHEQFGSGFLLHGEIGDRLRNDWKIEPQEIAALLSERPRDNRSRILYSMLSGPIDIDKMDYLARDSIHSGVPYGRHFDQGRLISNLCLNRAGDGLAITDKGKTAAELMVFARYVMFSEVYWHHAVRAATAMLQRAFYLLAPSLDLMHLFHLAEGPMVAEMKRAGGDGPAGELLAGLFGEHRTIYKRLAQYSIFEHGDLYARLARRPYPWLAQCAEVFTRRVSAELGSPVASHEILFDSPPVQLEVQFDIEVYSPKEDCYRALEVVSPVVRTLAKEQFDDYVKRVRIFAHPRIAKAIGQLPNLSEILVRAIDEMPPA